ncbi:hypothetical protein HQ487_00755 [Candidatus Uhrbacteria bacterium]|nr:hypothetical protein [Candidatus Uhrbacteria bacterium]
MRRFIHTGSALIAIDTIDLVDLSSLELGRAKLLSNGIEYELTGTYLIELLMELKPSALEGRRLRWMRHRWVVHNLLGHPLMQLFVFVNAHKLALWIHEATVPRPTGFNA